MNNHINKIPKLDKNTINRFLDKILIYNNNECWEWKSTTNHKGYGRFSFMRNSINYQPQAHRVSYMIFKGEIPKEKTIHHICHNKKCVNPDHLEPRTNIENIMEGNCWSAINSRKTHCINGHKFDYNNTYNYYRKTSSGKETPRRGCRKCRIIRDKNSRLKRLVKNG